MANEQPDSSADPLAWRRHRDILPLKHFDFPEAHKRTRFDESVLASIACGKMSGNTLDLNPVQVRDAIRSERLDTDQRDYLHGLITQFDGLEMRLFSHCCGGSIYELARTMIACNIRHPFLAEWMNCRAPGYEPPWHFWRAWPLGLEGIDG